MSHLLSHHSSLPPSSIQTSTMMIYLLVTWAAFWIKMYPIHRGMPHILRAKWCCVCQLETQFHASWNMKIRGTEGMEAMKEKCSVHKVVACTHPNCMFHAHFVWPTDSDRFIFQNPMFNGMTCFKIAHSTATEDLWQSNLQLKYKDTGSKKHAWLAHKKKAYSVSTCHPLYTQLRLKYGW